MLRSKRDREALQKIGLKQPFQEFPHGPSLFLPSSIVKQRLASFCSVYSALSVLIPFRFFPALRSPRFCVNYSVFWVNSVSSLSACRSEERRVGKVFAC